MLWFAFFLNQGDRQVYGAIVEDIQRALDLTGTEAGLVVTVFTVVYGCLAPFGGYVGDFLSRKWIVISSLIVFSLGTLFTGFAGAMGGFALVYLIIMRGIATGAGEAFYNPAAISLITQHHEKTRGTAISLHQSALYVGIVASAVIGSAHLAQFRLALRLYRLLTLRTHRGAVLHIPNGGYPSNQAADRAHTFQGAYRRHILEKDHLAVGLRLWLSGLCQHRYHHLGSQVLQPEVLCR